MELVQAQRLLQYNFELSDFNISSLSKGIENIITLRKIGEYYIADVPFLKNKTCVYIPFIYEGYLVNWYDYDH